MNICFIELIDRMLKLFLSHTHTFFHK